MELKYVFSVGIVCKLLCGRGTKGRIRLIFIPNFLVVFIISSGLQSMEMVVERQPSPEQEHTFKAVLMKILFLGSKETTQDKFSTGKKAVMCGSYSNHPRSELGLFQCKVSMLIPIIMFYMTNTMLNYFADEGAFGNQKTFTYLGFD